MSFGSRSLPPPTAEQLRRWVSIKEMRRCCGCNIPGYVEIHHLLSGGGLRLGHRYTVGLCRPCHANVKTREFKATWPNQELLDHQDRRISWPVVAIPARRERPEQRDRAGRRSKQRSTITPAKVFPRGNRIV